ncbi:protein RdmE [Mangrovactinospora gilvigrisea]|uniref:Protein RdmE n=1 Tax=Mangrovactinospora gilvigrisea TaxID=1428644 RepID=A0A1J7C3Z8_9ACTN|nr:FAD-dependent oxidoreductase [Mangrovactinospora gilvigrisea]OIV36292.1 protein RdmE [Mangrovactinospora gilvigrisea]
MPSSPSSSPLRVPVLVVGAGYAGLTAAACLARHGVRTLLVERHPSTSVQPKAFGLISRTVECLRILPGVEQELADASQFDFVTGARIVIAQSLRDPDPKVIMGGPGRDLEPYRDLSPSGFAAVSQAVGERILRGAAERLGAELRFGTELLTLAPDAEGVTAVLSDGTAVRADYVVAADGHRSPIRSRLGIPVRGKGDLGHTHFILFDADLDEVLRDQPFTLTYLQNEVFDGAFTTTDTGSYGVGVNYYPERGQSEADFTPERCVELVRIATGVPGLDPVIVDHADFTIAHRTAVRSVDATGRVLLAGDAAHTMPPTGGQGGNTAIQDGADAAWRLALAVGGGAGPGLIAAYDTERRALGELVAGQQLANYAVRMAPQLKGDPDLPEPLKDPMAAALGFRYRSGVIAVDTEDAPVAPGNIVVNGVELEDPLRPSARPGFRAPNLTLHQDGGEDGEGRSIIDFFGLDLVLLTDLSGAAAWTAAARDAAEELGAPVTARTVDSGWWEDAYGVAAGGAVLVRPDGFIAWRTRTAPAPGTHREQLTGALRTVLGLPRNRLG